MEQDFGTLENTQTVERVFRIRNGGDVRLRLGPIRPCLGVQISLATNVIAPGTSTALTVTMPLRDCRGAQNKRIYVGTDDPQQPYLMVRLSGTVVTREDLLPLRIKPDRIDFGTISSRSVTGVTVTLTARSNAAFRIKGVTVRSLGRGGEDGSGAGSVTEPPVGRRLHPEGTGGERLLHPENGTSVWLRADWREVRTGSVAEVTLRTVPPLPIGRLEATVSIRTDFATYPNIVIPVSGTVVSDLIAVPDALVFTAAGGAVRPETRKIVIRSRAGQAFRILKVDPPLPNMEVSIAAATGTTIQAGSTRDATSGTNAVGPAAEYEITLHKVVFVREMDGKSLVVTTDQGDGGTVAIPFRMQADGGKNGAGTIEELPTDFLVK